MEIYESAAKAASRWMGHVSAVVTEAISAFTPDRHFRLIEQEDGTFLLEAPPQGEARSLPCQRIAISDGKIGEDYAAGLAPLLKGAQVELVLRPRHFLFRLIDLPRRASEFLDGIVRAQIDRLTPWTLAEAAFGWHLLPEARGEQLTVAIAATSRALIAPFAAALSGLGAGQITVLAAPDAAHPGATAIKVFERKARQEANEARVRRFLTGLLVGAGLLSALSAMASSFGGSALESRREEILRLIAERREAIKSGKASAALLDLERRKQETPSAVIVIEALSRILPDDTYLTELRIAGDKVQIVGMTRDTPSLIRLLEQTSHFTHATFFSPTTRSKTDQAEHFSIEAHVEPSFALD